MLCSCLKRSKKVGVTGLLYVLFSLVAASCHGSKNIPQDYIVEPFVDGIEIPWGMVQLKGGDILVSERSGRLRVIRNGALLEQEISGLPDIHVNGQGGLLDLALHPQFNENRWLYFTFSSPKGKGGGSNTALMRAKLNLVDMKLEQHELLYKGLPNTYSGQHYGSRIVFDDDGFVYFSIGDRGDRENKPQSFTLDGGKIYRLHDDGRIPEDNPWRGLKGSQNMKLATFSYGHRNPQGLAKHPDTGEIWSHEHGPKGGDELNIIEKGVNYGWPIVSYGVNYSGTKFTELTEKEGMKRPLFHWTPSIAPSGMLFVTSDKYPGWQGKLMVGSLKFDYVALLDVINIDAVSETPVFEGIGRVRSLMQGKDGFIYVGVDGEGIKRITPVYQGIE